MAAPLCRKFTSVSPFILRHSLKSSNLQRTLLSFLNRPRARCFSDNTNQEFKSGRSFIEVHDESGQAQRDILYQGHIPITSLQRGLLAVGSAAMALLNPRRDDMVAICGETTAYYALKYMEKKMESDPVGRQILLEQPKINKNTVDLEMLRSLPEDTFGKAYVEWMDVRGFDPDGRRAVHFIDEPQLAYVMLRYRQCHDLIHTLLGMKPDMQGEVAVKWFEAIQTRLPMCAGAAIFGPIRFGPKQRRRYIEKYWSWAVRNGINAKFYLNVYYEKEWEKPLDQLRKEMNIQQPPVEKQCDWSEVV